MSKTYQLEPHQEHSHIRFAYVDGHHFEDFATHKHDFSELFFVIGGSGKHTVADYEYPIKKGDVFVINGDIAHGFSNVNNLKIVNLMFDTTTPFFELPSMRQLPGYQALFKVEPLARQKTEYKAKLTLTRDQIKEVGGLLTCLKEEYYGAKVGYELMLISLMQQLVVTLSRMYQDPRDDLSPMTLALSRALVFIEQNFSFLGVNSDEIAKAAFISKRQLERLFRQYLNTSPNQYLREVQLKYASQLLVDNVDYSIQEVAEHCGFSDSNYFSKCFKHQYLQTPREYRRSGKIKNAAV
ncbi:AraC family transcriptional regulator [uncultured Vibrio sp.]|uniref:AraC family transcriptional regulator n=1 Tax=uncultured Vibrio sp. TaxID=114054 RepID=UPI0026366A73|nr:AraC family transcriptional regulator [uncultured Vibrio sp.]